MTGIILIGPLIGIAWGQERGEWAVGNPKAVVDLRTAAGVERLGTEWKVAPAELRETTFAGPGPSDTDPLALYPTGTDNPTLDVLPRAWEADFDDSTWTTLPPDSLEKRLGPGRLSMVWYRLSLTLPNRVGDLDVSGSTAVFEIVVDDYAEVLVNGELKPHFGKGGGPLVAGFNARNRVVLTDDAQPGDTFDIAVLGINGPLAKPPANYVWVRSATVDFYREPPRAAHLAAAGPVGSIVRHTPEMDDVVAPDAPILKVATGFQFGEGPVWHPDGYLLFSDPNANVIYSFDPATHNVGVYLTKTGYAGEDIGRYRQPGSNGLAIDAQGRLTVCQHGNRQVIRHERKGPITVLANRFEGQRINSPNDLVYRSDGTLFFTDPPYGLPEVFDDPEKETPFSGIYALRDGKLTLGSDALNGPNGLALSPDERFLYVGNWDITDIANTKQVWRYPVRRGGSLGRPQLFFSMNHDETPEGIDGIKVDTLGRVFISGPGGIWVVDASGRYLGKIKPPERPANMAFGDDGRTLYMTAHTSLYTVPLVHPGPGFAD